MTAGIAPTGGDPAPAGTASHRAATDMQPARRTPGPDLRRAYLTGDAAYGKAGTLLSATAELEHAVVDEAGRRPTDAQRTRTGRRG